MDGASGACRIDSLQNQGLTRNLQEREEAKPRLLVFPESPTCAACGSHA
jgi:hypothetical protein